jgi:transposase InsO family protein
LLAPGRQPQPVEPKRHDGTILAERPNQMWGIDATAGFTAQDGQVAIFAMVDHYSAYCLGIHAAKRGTRFEAPEPVQQAVKEQFGGFVEAVAAGVQLRHDHGSQFMSADLQAERRSVVNQRPNKCSHAVWRHRVPAWILLNSGSPAGR